MVQVLSHITCSFQLFHQQYYINQQAMQRTDCRTLYYINRLLKIAGKTTISLRDDDFYTDEEIRDLQSSFGSIVKEFEQWKEQKTVCQGCAQLRKSPTATKVLTHFEKYVKIQYDKKQPAYENNKIIITISQSKTKKIREFAQLIHQLNWCKVEMHSYNKIPQIQKHPFLIDLVTNQPRRQRYPTRQPTRSKSKGPQQKSAKQQAALKYQERRPSKVEVKREESIMTEVKKEFPKQEDKMDIQ